MFPVSEANINTAASAEVNFDGGQFVGTLSPVAVSGGDKSILFMGAASTLYYPSTAMTIGAYRAYFHIDSGTDIKEFRLNFGEEDADAIQTLSDSPLKGENIYNLAGQRLNRMQKGINIVNGKKILFK